VAVLLGMAAGLLAVKTGWTRAAPAHPSPSVSLMAYDLNGQLQIRWDWAAESILSAEGGTLQIADGATRTVIALEKQRLRRGTVSYVRIGARVDVRLALQEPGGDAYEEFTSFVGLAGGRGSDGSMARLRGELQDQAGRMREVERAVPDLRMQDNPR
jgi:hypothetical protein